MRNNNLDVAMYIIDEDYKILFQNEAATRVHPEAQVGNVCYKFYGGLDAPCTQCPIFKKNSLMYNPHRKEWVEASAAQMELPGHGTCYAIQFQVKQRLSNAQAGEELADYESLDTHIAEISAVNGDECLIGGYCEEGFPLFYVNDNMIALLGYDNREEFMAGIDGMVINTIHPDDRAQVQQDLGDTYYPGMVYETMYRMPKKDGTWFWTVDKGKVVQTQSGRLAIISVCSDMTEHLKRQEDLRLRNEDLLKRFISSMSHDIRTPMNAIIGMTTLASKHIDDMEYVKNCLSKMSLASKHLLTLINDVLDISKVESGKVTLNPVVFSLSEAVSNLVNIVRQQISGKGHKFDVRIHNIQHEYLFADELRLNQIFINILSNAVKYTPDGGRISVDFIEESIEGVTDAVRLIYIVQDNGVGMSREFQENMYNSYTRSRGANYDAIQGSGVGLTITKTMVELLDGTIECESELGEGTKFTITLELPIAEKSMEDLVLPSMNILLVDDDAIFLETAADTLQELGLTPECATSGEEALRAVVEKHKAGEEYPVVIVDWQMPGMSGMETIREIRAKVGQEVSIIATSAYDGADIEPVAKETGADGFISKPFFISSVYRSMIDILGLAIERPEETEELFEEIAGMHLLIAEDNDLNWEIAKEILKLYKVTTVRADNGRDCVNKLNESEDGEYDMVLMDIRMPVMNGYDATEIIRNSEREYIKNIPIVAMTADAFSDDIERCLNVGMSAHIAKPININGLLTILANVEEQNMRHKRI